MVLHSPHSPLTMECKYDHYETMSPVSPATSNRGVHCSPVSLMVEMPWRWQAKCPSKSDQVGREKNWENTNIKQRELNFGYLVLEFCDCLWDSSISTQTSCTLHLPSTIIRRISSTQGKCEILFLFLRQLLNSKEGKNNSESPRNVLWWQQFFPHLLPCYIRPLFCLAGKCLFVDRRAASARTASVSQNRNQRNTTRKSSSFTECPDLKTVKTVTACKPSCVKTLEPTTLQCLKHQTTPQRNPIGSSRDTEWNMIHSYPLHGSPWVLKQGTWPSKFFQTSPLAQHQAMNSSGVRGLIALDLLCIPAMFLLVAGQTSIYWVYTAIHHGFHSLHIKCDLSHSSTQYENHKHVSFVCKIQQIDRLFAPPTESYHLHSCRSVPAAPQAFHLEKCAIVPD